jgi:hypothetical protein
MKPFDFSCLLEPTIDCSIHKSIVLPMTGYVTFRILKRQSSNVKRRCDHSRSFGPLMALVRSTRGTPTIKHCDLYPRSHAVHHRLLLTLTRLNTENMLLFCGKVTMPHWREGASIVGSQVRDRRIRRPDMRGWGPHARTAFGNAPFFKGGRPG